MSPTLEEYQSGTTRWVVRHSPGLLIEIAHHSHGRYHPEGIWNFYLILDEEFFPDPQLFRQFLATRSVTKLLEFSPYREQWAYEKLPDPGYHGGVTFYEQRTAVRSDNGQNKIIVKIGCDYGHLWDKERGYPDTLESVKADATRAADNLLAQRFED